MWLTGMIKWSTMTTSEGQGSLVNKGKPVCNGCRAIQAQVRQLQAVQQPFQDVQHGCPLAEYERVVPLCLHIQGTHSNLSVTTDVTQELQAVQQPLRYVQHKCRWLEISKRETLEEWKRRHHGMLRMCPCAQQQHKLGNSYLPPLSRQQACSQLSNLLLVLTTR